MKRKIDYYLLIPIVILSLFGLLMVYSASNVVALNDYNDSYYYFKKQLLFMIVGYIIMFIIIKLNIQKIYRFTPLIFLLCLGLLILVLIPGIGIVRGGARSWIGVGMFSIQPSEFMKVGLILLLSKYLSRYYYEVRNVKNFILLSIIVIIVFALIMLQPDFGTGLVIILSCFCFLYISGANYKLFIIIGIVGLFGIGVLVISAPYRLQRILAFLDPWQDPLGSGFQGIQSLFAITPGGLFGHGFNNSIQKHFFLPEPQNDFIFAIVVEEFGLIGGGIVILLFFCIIYRALKLSQEVDEMYCKFLLIGLSLSLAVQVFINIGVVVGLLPVTGITLPLFSYGGSSLLINFVSFGLMLHASKYRNI